MKLLADVLHSFDPQTTLQGVQTQVRRPVMKRVERAYPYDPAADRAMIDAFVEATRGLQTTVACKLIGVNPQTITKWRNGEVKRLSRRNRDRISAWLSKQDVTRGGE